MEKDNKVKKKLKVPARSVAITQEEIHQLKQFMEKYANKTEAAMIIRLDRTVITNVIARGSGSEKTVKRIKAFFKAEEATS